MWVGRDLCLLGRGICGVRITYVFAGEDVRYRELNVYYQAGKTMNCVNCGRAIHSKDINVITGGCNPAPVQRTIDGTDVLLKASDLDSGAVYF